MRTQELTDILKPLSAEALRRLANRLDLESGTKAELLRTLSSKYSRRPGVLLDEMRSDDLYQCLRNWDCETDRGEYSFSNLSKATLADLLAAARRLWVENWRPTRKEERVVPGSQIMAFLLDDDDVVQLSLGSLLADFETEDVGGDDSSLPSYEEVPTSGGAPLEGTKGGLSSFQKEAVTALTRKLSRGPRRRALLCLPTGGGKTRTALHLLLANYIAEGKKVLWVTHRIDLLDQVHEEIRESVWQISNRKSHVRISRVHAGVTNTRGDFVLASSMSLVRNDAVVAALNRDRSLAIVVYDEAHRLVAASTWKAVQHLLQGDRALLGLTATPYRKDPGETRALEQALGKPAYFKSFGDLLQAGFLARPVFLRQRMRSTETFRLSEAELKESAKAGEFSPSVLAALARNKDRDKEIVTHWCSEHLKYGKTIAFACDIEHAEQLARTFQRHNVRADSLHSRHSPDRRRRALSDFKEGKTTVLVNVGILTEGTNVPDTKTVLLTRPTLSRSLYMQMIGRGARGPNTVQGKTTFYVIDCVDNFQVHGFTSAGTEVAQELEQAIRGPELSPDIAIDDARPTEEVIPVKQGVEIDHAKRLDAALRLLLRGLTPSAYSLWGELRWGSGDPTSRPSAAVFLETRGFVEAALQRLATAGQNRNFDRMDAEGVELDVLGALRREQWTTLWVSYRDHGHIPELVEAGAARFTEDDLLIAEQIDVATRQHPDWDASEWREHLRTTPWLRRDFEAAFGSIDAGALVLARVAADILRSMESPKVPASDTIQTRNFGRDARDFSTIAYALLQHVPDSKQEGTRIIDVSCGLLFAADSYPPEAPVEIGDDEIRAAASRLGDGITSDRGAEEMDHLLRIVLADKVVDERERHILHLVAPYLGFPEEVLAGRLAAIEEIAPEIVRESRKNSGTVTCHVCNEVLPEDSRFCGACGNALHSSSFPPSLPPNSAETSDNGFSESVPPLPEVAATSIESTTVRAGGVRSDDEQRVLAESVIKDGLPSTPEIAPADSNPAVAEPDVVHCRVCTAAWPAGSRYCGACSNPIAGLVPPSLTNAPASPAPSREPIDHVASSVVGVPYVTDTSGGYAAERWLHRRLASAFGEAFVLRNVAPFGGGQSDFVVRVDGLELHLELKHVAARNGRFHWSGSQVELARKLIAAGRSYCLVVAHPRGPEDYELHWCHDPREVFRDAPKMIEHQFTCAVRHDASTPDDAWDAEPPPFDATRFKRSLGYWIALEESGYRRMRAIAENEDPIAPALEWVSRIARGGT